jgi:hypothetical protein
MHILIGFISGDRTTIQCSTQWFVWMLAKGLMMAVLYAETCRHFNVFYQWLMCCVVLCLTVYTYYIHRKHNGMDNMNMKWWIAYGNKSENSVECLIHVLNKPDITDWLLETFQAIRIYDQNLDAILQPNHSLILYASCFLQCCVYGILDHSLTTNNLLLSVSSLLWAFPFSLFYWCVWALT